MRRKKYVYLLEFDHAANDDYLSIVIKCSDCGSFIANILAAAGQSETEKIP